MKKILLGMAAASAMLFATTASAALMLTVEDLDVGATGSITVTDTDGDGFVGLSGVTVGDWLISNASGFSEPSLFLGPDQLMHLDSVDATSGVNAGTLRVTLEDDAYLGNIGSVIFNVAAQNSVGTSEFWAYVDGIEFAHVGPSGTLTYTSGVFDITSNPFNLKIVAEINHTSSGISSFNANVDVPEPSIIALLGAGLLGLGLARRRMKK